MDEQVSIKQNDISQGFEKSNDLRGREQELLKEISRELQFAPSELLWRSTWWGSDQVGAFHYRGLYNGQLAILKVQGVKPAASEIGMLQNFSRTNESKLVRPPHLYAVIPWADAKGYEVLLMEDVGTAKVVPIGSVANKMQIDKFFKAFEDYRKNCRNHPWVEKQKIKQNFILDRFSKWRLKSCELYPHYPHRAEGDELLVDRAVEILTREYSNIQLEFQHAHLSVYDMYEVGDEIVFLSNLFWSWRPPFYDAVFAYHWFPYNSANDIPGITAEIIDQQLGLWLQHLNVLAGDPSAVRFLKLAMLERAAAGLTLDMFIVDPTKEIAKYTAASTRRRLIELIDYFA